MLKEIGNLYWSTHEARTEFGATPDCAYSTNYKLNIAILYGSNSTFTSTVKDHLDAFRNYSHHNFYYFDAILDAPCNVDLNFFDVVVIHYGCGLYHPGYFSRSFEVQLESYGGVVIAFCQDEYDSTNVLIEALRRLRVSVVFTCVPDEYVPNVYLNKGLSKIRFINNLTGYVPEEYVDTSNKRRPIKERGIWVGYRGRPLHLKYGELGIQKIEIGKVFDSACKRVDVPHDIKWTEEDRIYWAQWKEFLSNCRATLGTESGSNVFDYDGEIRKAVDEALSKKDADTQEIYDRLVKPHECVDARMNQVSPKMFEAIALGTGLILMEGTYSGILHPWEHYIPVKKDYSNLEEVFSKLGDVEFMTNMTESAYDEVVRSGKYSFKAFARMFDGELAKLNIRPKGLRLINALNVVFDSNTKWEIFPNERRDRWNKQWNDRYLDCSVVNPGDNVCANGTTEPLFYYDIQASKLMAQSIFGAQTTTCQGARSATRDCDAAENKYRELASLSISNYLIGRSGALKGNDMFCRMVRKGVYMFYPIWQKSPEKIKTVVRSVVNR